MFGKLKNDGQIGQLLKISSELAHVSSPSQERELRIHRVAFF